MDDSGWLARRFEDHRAHLRTVAHRMLGSPSEADDAVQEAWLRLSRSDTSDVANLGGWLTTVVARVCLDMLRTRASRREEPLEADLVPPAGGAALAPAAGGADPEHQAVVADSVGVAMLVVLDTLAPAERIAFVLHDMFDVPFDEIAPIVDRSPVATRQLASRARRRVRAATTIPDADVARQRELVSAFLAASRDGAFDALLALLDPDIVVRADRVAAPAGGPVEVRGVRGVAGQALMFAQRARHARIALVNGAVGIAVVPHGRPVIVMTFGIRGGRIAEMDVIADPARLGDLDVVPLDG